MVVVAGRVGALEVLLVGVLDHGQEDAVAEGGFRGQSLERVLAEGGPRQVAITFDDGTRGQFDHAVPALRARNMTATFYVTTEWVGRPGYMTWSELVKLLEWGMSVQSHTRTHPFLSQVDSDRLRSELFESRRELDRRLGQQTMEIAFPGGDMPVRRFRSMIVEAGYRVAVGTRWGTNSCREQAAAGFHPVRRCTVRADVSAEWTRRVISGDPLLTLRHYTRETGLRTLRSTLGAKRYARWRRRLLDAVRPNR